MAILDCVQTFTLRTGIPKPTTVFGSLDPRITQIGALANELLEEMVARSDWQGIQTEIVFTSLATESQGTLTQICSERPARIINDTINDRTMRLPIYGPINPRRWQQIKALPNIGPFYKYRIRNDQLLINPIIPAGHTLAFEFISKNLVTDANGLNKPYFTADSDTFRLDESLINLGLRWKWKSEKGLDYAEERLAFETTFAALTINDGTAPVLLQDGGMQEWQPGIFVPLGNWSVS